MSLEIEFTQKFESLNSILLDEQASFSGSAMYEDLMELEPLAKQIGLQSEALLKLYNALSLLQKKRGDTEDQIRFSQQALEINQQTQSLSINDQVLLYTRIIEGFEDEGEWDQAIEAAILQSPLADRDPELSKSQRIFLYQKHGYLLHEAARYQEALDLNLQTLQQAEKTFGEHAEGIIYLLINIAQNQFELGKFTETESSLKRGLVLARKLDTADQEFEMLFQLGVLAHETGDDKTAESYFLQYQALAEELEDDDYIERANILLEDLASKQL